ncbi:MAG TPA: DinB family protein [Gemmatimonadaceae bacterium]|nr:DinB family protein [Gemmatimonadaceae bacterium]
MSRPKSDLEALRQDLHQVYAGDPWHGSSITEVLKGIDADVAARRSIPHAHTIWEIVLHMTGWTREVASRVRGAAAKSPPEDWPAVRFGGGEPAWTAAKDDLAAAQREIEVAVGALEANDLVRWIENHEGAGFTVGTVIRGLLQHHTYHEGQIAILKRAAISYSE